MSSRVTEALIVGSRDALSDALAIGGNPDDEENSISALTLACVQKREDLVAELLRYGAKVDSRDSDGATVLHTAASVGSCAIVQLLLERGANKEARTLEGQTPLMRASHSGDEETVRLLCHGGANAMDKLGRNAIHWAAIGGDHVAACVALIEAGADPFLPNHEGMSPLQYAVALRRKGLIDLIYSQDEDDMERPQ
jgi:ankyrin repeat protein